LNSFAFALVLVLVLVVLVLVLLVLVLLVLVLVQGPLGKLGAVAVSMLVAVSMAKACGRSANTLSMIIRLS
jgi:hypothetical protein